MNVDSVSTCKDAYFYLFFVICTKDCEKKVHYQFGTLNSKEDKKTQQLQGRRTSPEHFGQKNLLVKIGNPIRI